MSDLYCGDCGSEMICRKTAEVASQPLNDLLVYLVTNEEKLNSLLKEIDVIARDEDSYEYGLPLWCDNCTARLREAIYRWAAAN